MTHLNQKTEPRAITIPQIPDDMKKHFPGTGAAIYRGTATIPDLDEYRRRIVEASSKVTDSRAGEQNGSQVDHGWDPPRTHCGHDGSAHAVVAVSPGVGACVETKMDQPPTCGCVSPTTSAKINSAQSATPENISQIPEIDTDDGPVLELTPSGESTEMPTLPALPPGFAPRPYDAPYKERYPLEIVAVALARTGGFISQAAELLRCTTKCIYGYIKKYPELERLLRDIRIAHLDLAESKLIDKVRSGDLEAIKFFLKCQGKQRGYVERTELAGVGDKPLTFRIVPATAPEPDSREMSDANESMG